MHPCQSGRRCTCHSAGPSTNRTKSLLIAALIVPALAAPAPAPTALPFLYPTLGLERRVTDAGQAPDDPSQGFSPEPIQLSDLVQAGLPYKFVYDSTAVLKNDVVAGAEVGVRESSGAWVIEDEWQLHGKRFGPLSATATADITDDPLPTLTEPAATASSTTTTTTLPSILAIESSLPTGWADDAYRRSGMYAIPLVVSFSVVIALMIGSLIGALAIRRDRSRSRRRKKRLVGDDDSIAREKVVRKGLAARVGRALKFKDDKRPPPQPEPETEAAAEPAADVEVGEHAAERQRDQDERSDLEKRVKSWARRSASWRVQARVGMRRRIARGRKRTPADEDPDNDVDVIREDREGEERVEREEAEAAAEGRTSRSGSRAGTPVLERTGTAAAEDRTAAERPAETAEEESRQITPSVPTYASPTVPTYSSSSSSPGPSTNLNDAHPDAAPSDEPAYDDPGAGAGLPPAYRRGEGRAEIRRGKMPERLSVSSREDVPVVTREDQGGAEQERRAWSALDAYVYDGGRADMSGEGDMGAVTAHVATDDKRVLEQLHSMRGAPEEVDGQEPGAEAPREEEVFGVEGAPPEDVSNGSSSSGSVLPLPPSKSGVGPVARYGEADLCLPRYLDGAREEGLAGPSSPIAPSAPPLPDDPALAPSAPPLGDNDLVPSAPPLDDEPPVACAPPPFAPSAPPLHDDLPIPSAPLSEADDTPLHAPRLHHVSSSAPLLSADQ